MAQTVQVPGVGQLQFPDNMSEDDMSKAIQANYPQIHGGTQDASQGSSGAPGQAMDTDPTHGVPVAENMAAGMGKAFVDTWRAGKQIFGSDAVKKETQADIDESKKYDKALEASNAGKAGEMLGHMTLLAAAPEGFLASAVAGAGAGALTPTSTGESRTANTLLGGVLGGVGHAAGALMGKVVGGVIQPFRSTATAVEQAGADTLTSAGVPLSAAQQGGGKIAQTLGNIAGDNPLVGSTLSNQQKEAFTAAVLKNVGVSSNKADAGTMGVLKAKLGGAFDGMAAKYPIPMDDPFLTHLATIETAAGSELVPADMHVIQAQIDNLIDKAAETGTINGAAFQNVRSSLARLQKGNDVKGHWAGEIHDALADALSRNASKDDQQAITGLRTQYRAIKQIEPAIDAQDNVDPRLLYNSLDRQSNINQMVYGKGDQSLVQLATAGKNVLAGMKTPNSGTGQRVAGMLLMGSSLAAVDQLAHGDPSEALKVGLLGIAGPNIAKIVTENPASARLIAQWARSKVLSNFRGIVKEQGARMAGLAGSSALPTAGGSGIQADPDQSADITPSFEPPEGK